MQCELCGKETKLVNAVIEGTELKVCENCSSHGRVVAETKHRELKIKKQAAQSEQILETITPNAGGIIKKMRERMGLSQKEFAKLLNEKESIISKIETGQLIPSLDLARKLEKKLKLRLVDAYAQDDIAKPKASGKGMTVGDIISLAK